MYAVTGVTGKVGGIVARALLATGEKVRVVVRGQRGRKVVPVKAEGPLTVTDVGTMLSACLAGAGIAQIMALGVQNLLDDGKLVDLFPDWPGETFPLYAVHPSRRHPAAKVRAFIDFCAEIIH